MALQEREISSSSINDNDNDKQEQNSSHVITIVFLALFIDLLGFTLILPLFPSILDYYSQTEDGFYMSLQRGVDWFAVMVGMPPERKYNSVLFGGLIGSIFSILQFFSCPLTGAVSDSLGRRPVILMTVMGLITSYALWAASRTFGIFLLSRIVGGISKGNVSLSTAIIADLHSPKARSKGMAMIGVAFSLGFTLGPMIGAYLAVETEKGEVFYLHSALLALTFAVAELIFIFFLLPETLPKEKRVSSVTSGFQAAVDLLSPLALFQFSAVTRGKESPSEESHYVADSSFLVNWMGCKCDHAECWTAAVLLRCGHCYPVFGSSGVRLWLCQPERTRHGDPEEPGRPRQSPGAHPVSYSLLAGRGRGLLHHLRRFLPHPLRSTWFRKTGDKAGVGSDPRPVTGFQGPLQDLTSAPDC
ncbi:major facilitator superfamily domain-containing protein 10 isoform X1 [Egretta garzetta]|uniref:major facilitator superfamily domain-containing protein 10 isoform X1 n=1 Tax=Egretta garzetta TaxID=188379 RepID=UPI00163CEC44|nr:major facilitator superfamily domain-containing protein 10 isoform X1 [Egretta garzetta]XP_035754530.1 major facilitator superfamily domain-containing protein 10 isoform X1 [Egretta garzetta]